MAKKFSALKNDLKRPKTRLVVLSSLAIVVTASAFGAIYAFQMNDRIVPTSSVSNTRSEGKPSEITPEYAQLIEQNNQYQIEQAIKTGGSAIPTVLPEANARDVAFEALKAKEPAPEPEPGPSVVTNYQPQPTSRQQDMQARQEAIRLHQERMKQSARLIAQGQWSGYGIQLRTVSDQESLTAAKPVTSSLSEQSGVPTTPQSKMILRAGTTCYALLSTGLNTDDSLWASARLVQCRTVDGQQLTGTLTGNAVVGSQWATGVQFNFRQLSSPLFGQSIAVEAVSIDENTNRPSVRSERDSHMLAKMLAAGTLGIAEGVGAGLKEGGRKQQLVSSDGNQVVQTDAFTDKQLGIMGAAKAVEVASNPLNEVINRPPTHRIENDRAIGVYFLTDIVEQ